MITTGIIKASHELKFDSVNLEIPIVEFNKLGFEFGDSLDVYFSNGLTIKNVPYYDGYYPSDNNFIVCGYSSYYYPCLAYENMGAWLKCEFIDELNVEIKLNQKAKFKFIQDTFKQNHPKDINYYKDEAAFCNFRALNAKDLKDNFIYRGGSPICNDFGFIVNVNKLLKENNIQFILNLSDTKEELDKMIYECKDLYVYDLYKNNNIYPLDLSAFPNELAYAKKIVEGLKEMMKHDGPIYLHCMEGKDRTGFISILLLALTSGDLNDFEVDYMKTYDNFFYINKENEEIKYNLLKDHYFTKRLMNQFCNSVGITDFSNYNFFDIGIKYLKYGGMLDKEINNLINYLHK